MSASLATVLFLLFIAFLLVRMRSHMGSFCWSLWVPFLWVGINASRMPGDWFSSGTVLAERADISEGNFFNRNIFLCLMILGVIVLVRRRINWLGTLRTSAPVLILSLYFLISTLWSEYPFIAIKRWVRDVGDWIMVLVIITNRNFTAAFASVFLRCAIILVPLSVLFIKWYPELGRYYNRWTWTAHFCGVTLNKNSLGLLAMISGWCLLWLMIDVKGIGKRKNGFKSVIPEFLTFLMCIWLLAVAHSATALACFLLGSLLFIVAHSNWFRANMQRLSLYLFGVISIMTCFTISPHFRGFVAETLGRDATLTERTVIWEKSLKLETNPLFGSGFASTWLSKGAVEFVEEFHLSHSHNGYLETYLHSGFIGVALLLNVLVAAGRNVAAALALKDPFGPLFCSIFISGLFYNYTEVAFNRNNPLGMLMVLVSVCGLNRIDNSVKNFDKPTLDPLPADDMELARQRH